MNIAVVKDEIFLKHNPGDWHPERPERLERIYARLEEPDLANLVKVLCPREATFEELTWNHAPEYIKTIQQTAGQDHVQLDPDTITSPYTYEAAVKAVGAQFVGLDAIFKGQVAHVFALVRPPGHHAEYNRAMGFCIFNNVALAAHYAMRRLSCERVLIIDWDLHHGNGTQWSFYEDPRVVYFSTHQFPYYPGTGRVEEIGSGEGTGFTVNVPLPAGCGDPEYATVFRRVLVPVAKEFRPQVILISAGFDIYFGDPLGGMSVTPVGVAYLMRVVKELAHELCEGRILLTLEGGYSLQGLSDCTAAVILELAGRSIIPPDRAEELDEVEVELEVFKRISAVLGKFWPGIGG
ncbi:MAG: histone deacetylase [Thermodesulfobacteria bacterium]|nr:histone deacetylase [Thermodesulfobacteriota bacterium]